MYRRKKDAAQKKFEEQLEKTKVNYTPGNVRQNLEAFANKKVGKLQNLIKDFEKLIKGLVGRKEEAKQCLKD